jgi:hypothetical protein
MWPITQPGAVQKPDAVTVCNKGEGCAKMTTVQDGPGATFSCLPMSQVQTPPAPTLLVKSSLDIRSPNLFPQTCYRKYFL